MTCVASRRPGGRRLPAWRAGLLLIVSLTGLAGCRRNATPARPAERTAGQIVMDGLSGRTAVEAGRRAEKTLRQVSAQEARDLKEVLGE